MSRGLEMNTKCHRYRAIIPVAGFGTRLFPATMAIRKEFCPVPDADGLLKPAIFILLEELDSSGIEEICLVIQREDEAVYRSVLEHPTDPDILHRLPQAMQEWEARFRRIAGHVQFAYQDEMRGLGHAVLQAASFAGDEPVLVLLGDTLYRSHTQEPCVAQLLRAYEQILEAPAAMVAVQRVPWQQTRSFGIFAGEWLAGRSDLMNLTRICEKPDPRYARDHLLMPAPGHSDDENVPPCCYAAFGAYIIGPEVFGQLRRMVEDADLAAAHAGVTEAAGAAAHAGVTSPRPEVEFTEALAQVMQRSGMLAFVPDGTSFDIGNVPAYQRTVAEFAQSR